MYNKQKRRGLCHGLVLPAGVGMALTVCCPFDFERHTLWLLHCCLLYTSPRTGKEAALPGNIKILIF